MSLIHKPKWRSRDGRRRFLIISVFSSLFINHPWASLFYLEMSSGEIRRVSLKEIQMVQNLIERCLQLYMNQKEVVQTLLDQAKIEPGFTELVWQKLEEQNREFFKAYHLRLMVKQQIMIFNKLLVKQVELMRKIRPAGAAALPLSNRSLTGAAALPLSNGSLIGAADLPLSNGSLTFPGTVQQNPSHYSMEHTLTPISDNMHHLLHPPSSFMNGGPSMHQSMHISDDTSAHSGTMNLSQNVHISDDTSAHSGTMNLSQNVLLTQNIGMDMLRGMNAMAIKSEPSYSNSSVFMFSNGNGIDSRPTVGEASTASFNNTESNSHLLAELPPEADIGFLGHIPRRFSLSDLTAGFSQSSGATGENKRLDSLSEGLSYEGYSSSD